MFLKEVDFVGSMGTKIKFILIHNFSTIVKPIRHKVNLYASSSNFIPRLKDFIDVNNVNMIRLCSQALTNVQILKSGC